MLNFNQVFLPTLERLSQLVHKQYGCGFQYWDSAEIVSARFSDIRNVLGAGKTARSGECVYFPIFFEKELNGAVEIQPSQTMDEKTLHRLDQTVRLVLQSSLENVHRLDRIEVLEQQIQNSVDKEVFSEVETKVVNLAERRHARENAELPEKALPILETMSFPFLIEARSEMDAFKMAVEIHQLSGRRIFLPIEDLAPETFDSAATLRELGAATLYTAKVEALSQKIQQTLVQYYAGERKKDDPQIIVASTKTYAELKQNGNLIPDFVNRLAVGYLLMRESFSYYKADDIMEFFIDSLTGRNPS